MDKTTPALSSSLSASSSPPDNQKNKDKQQRARIAVKPWSDAAIRYLLRQYQDRKNRHFNNKFPDPDNEVSMRYFNRLLCRHRASVNEYLDDTIRWPLYPCLISKKDLQRLEADQKAASTAAAIVVRTSSFPGWISSLFGSTAGAESKTKTTLEQEETPLSPYVMVEDTQKKRAASAASAAAAASVLTTTPSTINSPLSEREEELISFMATETVKRQAIEIEVKMRIRLDVTDVNVEMMMAIQTALLDMQPEDLLLGLRFASASSDDLPHIRICVAEQVEGNRYCPQLCWVNTDDTTGTAHYLPIDNNFQTQKPDALYLKTWMENDFKRFIWAERRGAKICQAVGHMFSNVHLIGNLENIEECLYNLETFVTTYKTQLLQLHQSRNITLVMAAGNGPVATTDFPITATGTSTVILPSHFDASTFYTLLCKWWPENTEESNSPHVEQDHPQDTSALARAVSVIFDRLAKNFSFNGDASSSSSSSDNSDSSSSDSSDDEKEEDKNGDAINLLKLYSTIQQPNLDVVYHTDEPGLMAVAHLLKNLTLPGPQKLPLTSDLRSPWFAFIADSSVIADSFVVLGRISGTVDLLKSQFPETFIDVNASCKYVTGYSCTSEVVFGAETIFAQVISLAANKHGPTVAYLIRIAKEPQTAGSRNGVHIAYGTLIPTGSGIPIILANSSALTFYWQDEQPPLASFQTPNTTKIVVEPPVNLPEPTLISIASATQADIDYIIYTLEPPVHLPEPTPISITSATQADIHSVIDTLETPVNLPEPRTQTLISIASATQADIHSVIDTAETPEELQAFQNKLTARLTEYDAPPEEVKAAKEEIEMKTFKTSNDVPINGAPLKEAVATVSLGRALGSLMSRLEELKLDIHPCLDDSCTYVINHSVRAPDDNYAPRPLGSIEFAMYPYFSLPQHYEAYDRIYHEQTPYIVYPQYPRIEDPKTHISVQDLLLVDKSYNTRRVKVVGMFGDEDYTERTFISCIKACTTFLRSLSGFGYAPCTLVYHDQIIRQEASDLENINRYQHVQRMTGAAEGPSFSF